MEVGSASGIQERVDQEGIAIEEVERRESLAQQMRARADKDKGKKRQ